jgi:3-hydroxyacyl-[acyl-carrier-protein] dehydratase
MLDVKKIQTRLPHRYPFLLVDKIIELKKGAKIVGIKNVSFNEWFFLGHFPDYPIMPGVLIIEALAQTAGILVGETLGYSQDKLFYLAGLEEVRFRKPVHPGDTLRLEVTVVKMRSKLSILNARALVEEAVVCEAQILGMLGEKER